MTGIAFLPRTDGGAKMDWHEYFDDFDFYLATDWVLTTVEAGASDATEAISQAKDGVLLITNDAGDNDYDGFQKSSVAAGAVAESFKWTAGKRLYFGMRFQISDATQSDFIVGLHITASDPIGTAPTDGIYFRKDDGDALLDCVVTKNSTETGSALARKTLVAATWYVMEFYYDGATAANGGEIQFYVDGVNVGNVGLTNIPDDEDLAPSFCIQNGTTVAKTMSVDWIRVVQERV